PLEIGTIKNKDQPKNCIDAGADFVSCISMNIEVAAVIHAAGLLRITGCLTVTASETADIVVASIVKICPCLLLDRGYIHSINEIFPGLQFMPTGGVEASQENLMTWFKSGVVGVGMGSKLISKEAIEQENYNEITRSVKAALAMVTESAKAYKS